LISESGQSRTWVSGGNEGVERYFAAMESGPNVVKN
jgi:hypothetical protein